MSKIKYHNNGGNSIYRGPMVCEVHSLYGQHCIFAIPINQSLIYQRMDATLGAYQVRILPSI